MGKYNLFLMDYNEYISLKVLFRCGFQCI